MLDVATLLERCRAGDGLAWEALVRRYQSRVYAVASHYMANREEARDVAQEIFIRVYRRLDTFRGDERFLPWLLKLARNCCIDRLRRLKARMPPVTVPIEEGPEIPSFEQSAEDLADRSTRERLLYRALAILDDTNREMILLKDIQGIKLEEIARMLEIPLGTVKSRSHRARIELARAIRILDPSYGA